MFFSEYKIRGTDSYSAAFCLYTIYPARNLKIDSKSAVLRLFYKTLCQKKF